MNPDMLETLNRGDCVLVISPHLDDAVLSAGGLMDRAASNGVSVVAATVFTADAAGGEPSALVRELHAWWQLGSEPYRVRREEDQASVRSLGCDYIHGRLMDCIYRKGSDGNHLYSSRKDIFSPPSEMDPVWGALPDLLNGWVKTVRPTVILCPMTVGRHLDHVVTAEAFRKTYAGWGIPAYLYEDLPYATGLFPPAYPDSVAAAIQRMNWRLRDPVDIEVDFDRKFAAIMMYQSQIADIFPDVEPEEEFRRYMKVDAGYRERFWPMSA